MAERKAGNNPCSTIRFASKGREFLMFGLSPLELLIVSILASALLVIAVVVVWFIVSRGRRDD